MSGDIHDPRFIMQYPMPYLDHAPNLPDNDMDHAMEVASNQPGRSGIDRSDVSMDISQADSDEDNMQEVSDEIKIQIKQIQVDDDPIEMTGDGPKILIYHSHSRESYRQDPNDPYKEASAEAFRTDDLNHSIIKVGTALAKELTKRGLQFSMTRPTMKRGTTTHPIPNLLKPCKNEWLNTIL